MLHSHAPNSPTGCLCCTQGVVLAVERDTAIVVWEDGEGTEALSALERFPTCSTSPAAFMLQLIKAASLCSFDGNGLVIVISSRWCAIEFEVQSLSSKADNYA